MASQNVKVILIIPTANRHYGDEKGSGHSARIYDIYVVSLLAHVQVIWIIQFAS